MIAAAALVAAAVALARTPLLSRYARSYTALWLTKDARSARLVVGGRSEEHHRTRHVLRLVLAGPTTTRRFALDPGQTWQQTLPPTRRGAASLYRVGHAGVYRAVRLAVPATTGR
jgi:hypothetical protein